MALDGTFSGLKASVADFLNRGDLAASIPDFIVLAETQMARKFVSRSQQGMPIPRRLVIRADADFAIGAEYVAVPSDFFGPLSLCFETDPITELDYIDSANLQREKKRGPTWHGQTVPKFYAVVGGELQIFPVADVDYTGEMIYLARPPALSDNQSNWIYTNFPDAYLYGALMQSAPYLRDDPRLTTWGQLFTSAIDDICNSDPMPTDKSTLRTDVPRMGRRWGWDINSGR